MGLIKIENVLDKALSAQWRAFGKEHGIESGIVHVHSDQDNSLIWTDTLGQFDPTQPYFLGEVVELHFSAIALKLTARGVISLDDKILRHLPSFWQAYINPWNDEKLTTKITIRHLLNHTSGLPDLFQAKYGEAPSLHNAYISGKDLNINLENRLKLVKDLKPTGSPDRPTKSSYSFTNTYLLTEVLSRATGKSLGDLLKEMHIMPLGLTHSYIYDDPLDRTPASLYLNGKKRLFPHLMSSLGGSGSFVSNAKDNMAFTRAFFHAHVFPPEYSHLPETWIDSDAGNKRGMGIMRYEHRQLFPIFQRDAPLVGISSSTGAFALYHRKKGLFFTGYTGVLGKPFLATTLVWKLAKAHP